MQYVALRDTIALLRGYVKQNLSIRSPAERTGSREDFAGLILFLVSRASAYTNSETIVSDRGRLS